MAGSLGRRDWAWLPMDILDLILHKLVSLCDYIRFGAVCKPWLCVALDEKQKQYRLSIWRKQVPLLLIPTQDNNKEWRSLYSVTQKKQLDMKLYVPYNQRCCGSSHGWLIFVEINWAITLFKPSSSGGAVIHLPQITDTYIRTEEKLDLGCPIHQSRYQYDGTKVILSADPSLCPDVYEVVAIFGPYFSLFHYKPGYKSWKAIDWNHLSLHDVIFYKGMVYAASSRSRVACVDDISAPNPQLKMVTPITKSAMLTYLVESSGGELLFIKRIYEYIDVDDQPVTCSFEVFKIVLNDDDDQPSAAAAAAAAGKNMVKLESIGHDALFLGDNYSMSISTLDFPECQSNSIYYTDHYVFLANPYQPFGHRDIGIFNLENGKITQHYAPNVAHKDMPPPIWIVPTLQP